MKIQTRFLTVFFAAIFVSAGSLPLFAQTAAGETNIGGPEAGDQSTDLPQQALKEVSIDKFESDGFWTSSISSDSGVAISRLFEGSPSGKDPIADEEGFDIGDKYVLGTRVDFFRRGFASVFLRPVRPLPVEGVVKTISIWAAGRNYNHSLHVLIQDARNNYYELYMGNLNFQGWRKMSCAVPPQPDDGRAGVVQQDVHYNNLNGIRIVGFRIDCAPMETYGTYYLYLDDLRVVTDLFAENSRDPDDMSDDW